MEHAVFYSSNQISAPNYNARYGWGFSYPSLTYLFFLLHQATEEHLDTPLFVLNLPGMLPYPNMVVWFDRLLAKLLKL